MSEGQALKNAMRIATHPVHLGGPIESPVPGRTDHVPIGVPNGSHIIPADVVSGIGQGNTKAGYHALNRTFGSMIAQGRHAESQGLVPAFKGKRAPGPFGPGAVGAFKNGGEPKGGPVDIMAAGGEYNVPPEVAHYLGHGDMKHGHAVLDAWIVAERKKLIDTLKKLPGPKK